MAHGLAQLMGDGPVQCVASMSLAQLSILASTRGLGVPLRGGYSHSDAVTVPLGSGARLTVMGTTFNGPPADPYASLTRMPAYVRDELGEQAARRN
ncbi:hypothetical protein [Streptomyces hydrogenans]|uniref:hypothetical protein n=1 Tax=Streptomyces hydrogenans TaxID=1873719 RepID=UPI0037F82688